VILKIKKIGKGRQENIPKLIAAQSTVKSLKYKGFVLNTEKL
jgi:hypothetical protein